MVYNPKLDGFVASWYYKAVLKMPSLSRPAILITPSDDLKLVQVQDVRCESVLLCRFLNFAGNDTDTHTISTS
jgi:hypothetical protein